MALHPQADVLPVINADIRPLPLPLSSPSPAAAPSAAALAMHRCILVGMLIAGVLSIIPPLKYPGILAARALALLDLATLASFKSKDNWRGVLSLCLKGAGLILGILGIILALLPLSIAAFSVDIFTQLKEMVLCFTDKKTKNPVAMFFLHFGFLVVDVLALAAVITGGWQLAVAAASVASAVMLGVSIYAGMIAKSADDVFEAFCYAFFAGLSIATAVTSAQIVKKDKVVDLKVTNEDKENPMDVINKQGQVVATLKPGETQNITVPSSQADSLILAQHTELHPVVHYSLLMDLAGSKYPYYTTLEPFTVVDQRSPPFLNTSINGTVTPVYGVASVNTTIVQNPIIPENIPKLPFVGALSLPESMVAEDERNKCSL